MAILERTGDSKWHYKHDYSNDTEDNVAMYVKYIMSILDGKLDSDDEDLLTTQR